MNLPHRDLLSPALLLALAVGCTPGQNSAGLTNGPPPASSEKPAMRTDLPNPDLDNANVAGSASGGGGSEAGTGGRGSGTGGADLANPPGESAAPEQGAESEVRATPPTIESPSPGGAQGGNKPPGNINDGTPRSPSI